MNHLIKRTVCTALAAGMTFACSSLAPSASVNTTAADAVQKYEFEDGKTSGGKFYTEGWKGNTQEDGTGEEMDMTSFSGKGFAYLGQKGTTLSVEVEVPADGLYELSICYCEPSDPNKKVQYLNVNGVNQGELTFPHNLKFEETSGGVVMLKKGKNTIELKAYWGYAYYDYLTIKPASEKLSHLTPDRELSNPNASESAKRLFNYLCDQYGNHIIAGQQEYCGDHNYNLWNDPENFIKDNEEEFEYIKKVTGKTPAIRGIDLLAYRSNTNWTDHAPERVIQWVNEYKGIATVTWHWNVPTDKTKSNVAFYVESTGNTPFTTFSIKNALKEGTWEHEQIMADLDAIAVELKKMKDADVPILWRPLHEAEGAWFWWGAEGPEACKELYRLMYKKFTEEYGLDNLIWVWTSSTSPAAAEWYPGDDVVDMIGCDKYNAMDGLPNLSSIASTFYSLVQLTDCKKMVTMSENDSIPSLENLLNDRAAWLYFCPWYKNYLTSEQNNPADNLKEIYTSDYCITLDELPDLKKYPITGSGETPKTTTAPSTKPATTATTASTEEDIVWGDVNGDGKVTLADALAILQFVANEDKYPLDERAQKAADVYNHGDGITANDSLSIQRYDVKAITKLPESYMK